MESAWDSWRFFAGTGARGPEDLNPRAGDVIDLECRDKWTKFEDTPSEFFYGIPWNPIPPHGVSAPHLEIYRWRHCDPETARKWREYLDRLRSGKLSGVSRAAGGSDA